MYGYRFVHCSHRCITQRQTYNQSECNLSDDLDPAVETVFVVFEGFDVVIGKTEYAEDNYGNDHQPEIDVRQVCHQQHGQQCSNDEHYAAHGWHTFLTDIERVGLLIALLLGDIFAFQEVDKPVTEPNTDNKCQHRCQNSAERDVLPQSRTCKVPECGL